MKVSIHNFSLLQAGVTFIIQFVRRRLNILSSKFLFFSKFDNNFLKTEYFVQNGIIKVKKKTVVLTLLTLIKSVKVLNPGSRIWIRADYLHCLTILALWRQSRSNLGQPKNQEYGLWIRSVLLCRTFFILCLMYL